MAEQNTTGDTNNIREGDPGSKTNPEHIIIPTETAGAIAMEAIARAKKLGVPKYFFVFSGINFGIDPEGKIDFLNPKDQEKNNWALSDLVKDLAEKQKLNN